MTLRLPAGSRVFQVPAAPGGYTLDASGILVKDGAGTEVFRVWGTDPDDMNYNAWNFYAGHRAGASQPTDNASAGWFNTGVGAEALLNIAQGTNNTAIGVQAARSITDGGQNTAIGVQALYSCTEGIDNVAVGLAAGSNISTGSQNVTVGRSAGQDVVTGDSNTMIGDDTGRGITTGRANTILGANVGSLAADTSNWVIIADGDGNVRAWNKGDGWTFFGNVGFYGTTPPVTQALAIPDATDLASAITSLNAALQALRTVGLISF